MINALEAEREIVRMAIDFNRLIDHLAVVVHEPLRNQIGAE